MLEQFTYYNHGFVCIPVILACKKKGFFKILENQHNLTLEQLVSQLNANSGHLLVALRMFQSMNWLSLNENQEYSLNPSANVYQKIPEEIITLYNFSFESYLREDKQGGQLQKWIDLSRNKWNISNNLISDFLDGVLIIPILITLKKFNLLDNSDQNIFNQLSIPVKEELTNLFLNQGWIEKSQDSLILTNKGRLVTDLAFLITGAEAAYTSMLSNIENLIFGDVKEVFGEDNQGYEKHIDRTLNVVASGNQHEKYFADVEQIIINIFSNSNYEDQPKYIADVGCGDGTFLKRIYQLIKKETLRGKVLNQYPLIVIGIDKNKAALEATNKNLNLAKIPHLRLEGYLNNPQNILLDLKQKGIQDTENILHIRSFLDHDRFFTFPLDQNQIQQRSHLPYEGVFVDENGSLIPPHVMIQNLVEHLGKWSDILNKYGLILLDVHCLSPEVVYQNIGKIKNLSFDAIQAFSKQYLVEANAFLMSAAEVGLFPKEEFSKTYPNDRYCHRITLNYFIKKEYKIRHAYLSDLDSLIQLSGKDNKAEIINNLNNFSDGNCVLVIDNKIVAVVYSHKISNSIIEINRIEILPEFKDQGIDNCLREFTRQYLQLKRGIKEVLDSTKSQFLLQDNLNLETNYIPPCNTLEKSLVEIWTEVFNEERETPLENPISIKDDFFLLGGDSLMALEIFDKIEQKFGKKFPLSVIFQKSTIEKLAVILQQEKKEYSLLFPIQTKGNKTPLFCIPGIGGHCFYAQKFISVLGEDQPIYGFQLQEKYKKSNSHFQLEYLAQEFSEEILSVQPDGYYYLFGYSFGVKLAFEIAQQLYQNQKKVALLVLVDSTTEFEYLPVEIPLDIESNPIAKQIKEANIKAQINYTPQLYQGKVTLFRAKDSLRKRYFYSETGGWQDLALGGVEIFDFEGNHGSLIEEPHLKTLLSQLKICLEKSQNLNFVTELESLQIPLPQSQNDSVYYRNLAITEGKKGKIEQEIANYQKALNLKEEQPLWVYKNLTDALVKQGQIEEALIIGEQAIQLYDQQAGAYHILGDIQRIKGEIEKAVISYEKVIELGNNQIPESIFIHLGNLYYQQEKLDKGKFYLEQAIIIEPKNHWSYISLAKINEKENKIEQAIDYYEQALKIAPNNFEANHRLGVIYSQQENLKQATIYLEKALSIKPDHSFISICLEKVKRKQID